MAVVKSKGAVMDQKISRHKLSKLKQFFLSLIARIDKKMEERSRSSVFCCKSSDKGNKSCCS